jgi:hypothetical protein
MTQAVERIDQARAAAGAAAEKLAKDPLSEKLRALDQALEKQKKLIVATKEGGAITGEERLREHADILYGALLAWEGRPTRYQVERIGVLSRELAEVEQALDGLFEKSVGPVNKELEQRKLTPIPTRAPEHTELIRGSSDLKRAFGRFLRLPVETEEAMERD